MVVQLTIILTWNILKQNKKKYFFAQKSKFDGIEYCELNFFSY